MSEVRISRSVLEGPFDFEITRVDCMSSCMAKFSFSAPHFRTNDVSELQIRGSIEDN